jgi:hypothetical protein
MAGTGRRGDRRAVAEVYVGGYEPAEGHPAPDPPVPDGPWTVEEWDGAHWVTVGTAENRSDLRRFGTSYS